MHHWSSQEKIVWQHLADIAAAFQRPDSTVQQKRSWFSIKCTVSIAAASVYQLRVPHGFLSALILGKHHKRSIFACRGPHCTIW